MSNIIFNQESANPERIPIEFAALDSGIEVQFGDEQGEILTGQIIDLYKATDEDDSEFISGCKVKTKEGKEFELFENNGDKLWTINSINSQIEEEESPVQEKKKERKPLPNLFQGRTEAEIKNAQFPDWDIVPPNQIINPRTIV